MSEWTAQKGFSRFSSGYESLEDKLHIGCLFILYKDQLEKKIKQNPNQTCQELAHSFEVSDVSDDVETQQVGSSCSGRGKQVPLIKHLLVIALTPQQSLVSESNINM